MTSPAHVGACLRLIQSMLDRHDDRDHAGIRGHLIAARTQIEAVQKLTALSDPNPRLEVQVETD